MTWNSEESGPTPLECNEWIDRLLVDRNFLELKTILKSANANLFSIVAASHREMWHSAFLKWVLSPKEHEGIGLGSFPLECFLRALVLCTENPEKELVDRLSFEWIVRTAPHFRFECEASRRGLTSLRKKKGRARIDLLGEVILESDDPDERKVLDRIIIENKINASETGDQTEAYYSWAVESRDSVECLDLFVFLTPRADDKPKNSKFLVFSYQQLYDHVLKPVLEHPGLGKESRMLLDHYAINLALPFAGGKPMANTYKEICSALYKEHQEILDLVFTVEKGETPNSSRRSSRSYSVRLTDVVQEGDTLRLPLRDGTVAEARVRSDDRVDVVGHSDLTGLTVSRAACSLLGRNSNGWREWSAVRSDGEPRTLADLRDEFLRSTAEADGDE